MNIHFDSNPNKHTFSEVEVGQVFIINYHGFDYYCLKTAEIWDDNYTKRRLNAVDLVNGAFYNIDATAEVTIFPGATVNIKS